MQRRQWLRSSLVGVSALVSACSPLRVLNALVPHSSYVFSGDIPYGELERQRLDVYAPAAPQRPRAVVVFFYGGNWNSGQRSDYAFVGEALSSRGFLTVIPDYRLYPAVAFPDFLDDCALAVRWACQHAAAFGADPEDLYLAGHSAGAYNAAMLALDRSFLTRAGGVPPLRGWIGLAGPYDFLPLQSPLTKAVFGFPDTSPATQPIEFASAASPPALLVTGTSDNVVDPGNSARLAARLRSRGARVREIAYRNVGHRALVGALAAPLRTIAPVLDEVADFVGGATADDRP